MANGNMTTTTAAVHIDKVWVQDVIRAQEFKLVIAPRVYREWKYAGHGDTYHVPRVPNLTTNTKTGGSAWTPETLTDTDQTITVNVEQVAGFEIEDIVALLTYDQLGNEMKKKIGYSLGRAVDVNLATIPQNMTQNVGTLGVELTYDNLVRAWQYLTDAGIDVDDNCTWLITPAQKAGFLKQDIFINQLYTGHGHDIDQGTDQGTGGGAGDDEPAIRSAIVGRVLNAPVVVSNLVQSPSGGQANGAFFLRNAIALIMAMEPTMFTEFIAKDIANVVGGHQIYGYSEISRYSETPANVTATDNWGVLLKMIQ